MELERLIAKKNREGETIRKQANTLFRIKKRDGSWSFREETTMGCFPKKNRNQFSNRKTKKGWGVRAD